jgi:hypothetical protein
MHGLRGFFLFLSFCGAVGLALVVLGSGVFVSACGDDPPATVLQAIDLAQNDGGVEFNANNIIEPAELTDIETLTSTDADLKAPSVQSFLHRTPYDRPSFLETYQSNGIRASDAILKAARQYRINPLVFLVYAQTAEGLIGERNYPFPVDRVEYVFRCGCLQQNTCLANLAGFDRQVDCLGRAFRTAIDEIKSNPDRKTTSGWGPETASLTLDGVKVTPENDSTAALYDRTPRVNEGAIGGTWIFWNVWKLYARKLDYAGPAGAIDGRWIGEACAVDGACGVENAICATNYPDGLCTVACTGECPAQPSKPEAFCARFRDGGFCFQICNPSAPVCRPGYKCLRVAGVKGDEAQSVCSPDPNGKQK